MRNFKISWDSGYNSLDKRRPIVFVSATVYDKKDMLVTIKNILESAGYDVRISSAGTVPADSSISAYDNCLNAVKDSDFFIGIISPSYGSGIIKAKGVSITHEEIRQARELRKPRLILVDERVKTVADFLNHLGFRHKKGRMEFRTLIEHYLGTSDHPFKNAAKICDLRSVDLYDEMLLGEDVDPDKPAEERKGNWIQDYRTIKDFKTYLAAQFSFLQVTEIFEGQDEAVSLIKKSLPAIDLGKGV